MRVSWSSNLQGPISEEKPLRIPALDGMRAIAIALVLLAQGFSVGSGQTDLQLALHHFVAFLGEIGAALFFAISGFLITTLLVCEELRTGKIALGAFYVRRAVRILPAAYFYLLLVALAGIAGWLSGTWLTANRGVEDFLNSALLLRNYWGDAGGDITGWATSHFWAIAVVCHFYLLWPPVIAIVGSRHALHVAMGGIVASIVWRTLAISTPALSALSSGMNPWQHTDFRLDSFLWASLWALLIASAKGGVVARVVTSPEFRRTACVALLAIWLMDLFSPARVITSVIQSALLPALLLSVVLRSESPAHRFLEREELVLLGRISFGIFLWQQVLMPGGAPRPLLNAALAFPMRCVLLILFAAANYFLLEVPLRDFARRRLQARAKRKESQEVPFQVPLPQNQPQPAQRSRPLSA